MLLSSYVERFYNLIYLRQDHIIKKCLIKVNQNALYKYVFFITYYILQLKIPVVIHTITYLKNTGKDFIGIIVKENADSIIHMDNHNAESHSKQQQQQHHHQNP